MKTRRLFQKVLSACGRVLPGFAFVFLTREADANPTGLTVVAGSATAQTSGSQLSVTTSQNAVLNWSSFNIAAGERTVFNQPSASSVVFNRITDQNPSLIYGSLQANGIVVLLNSSGFYFGPNSFVSAAGLTVSTANCVPPQNPGGAWVFNGPPPLASIVNYGQIKIGNGGDCFFIADKVENHNSIEAPGGNIGFAAGQTVTLSERPDGRGMSMQVTLPQGSVDNYGNVTADGGTIALNAKVVNQNGFIQANSVQNVNGVIELVASDTLSLGASSQISANGDGSTGGSAGGSVSLESGNNFTDASGSAVSAKGGSKGGNGGSIEVSAPNIQSLASSLNASAQTGATAGQFQLNSTDIELNSSGANGLNGGTLDLNVNGTFDNFSQINLQSSGNIDLPGGTTWNLGAGGRQLTLNAAGTITLGNGSQLVADGGVFRLYSKDLNLDGLIQADSVASQHGTIELDASDSVTLGANSKITANGDNSSSGSAGGQIMVQAAQTFTDDPASQIQATGGANGGDGGRLLLYAAQPNVQSQLNVSPQPGFNNGSITYFTPLSSLTLTAAALTPFSGFSHILFQVNNSITLPSGTLSLSDALGLSSGQLTLEAGKNISFNNSALITDSKSWSLSLLAGYDFATQTVDKSGTLAGNIFLNGGNGLKGTGSIQLAQGDLNMLAGQDIQIGVGYARTSAGGSVTAEALKGNINTGTYAHGYTFLSQSTIGMPFYTVDTSFGAGGISTEAGGDVTIIAGGNVTSLLPTGSTTAGDAGSGAFGPQSGNVTVVAGGNVTGHYVEANGAGQIIAGAKKDASGYPLDADGNRVIDTGKSYVVDPASAGSAGTANANLALSLVDGGWTVDAAQDINLQELRNPNGVFNNGKASSPPSYHYFDYADNAYLNLTAGNAVNLGNANAPRIKGDIGVPFIYAPIMSIVAGSGGVTLNGGGTVFTDLILFPSAQGSLSIVTTAGGSLSSSLTDSSGAPGIFSLIVSDADPTQRQYYSSALDLFGLSDHAATPVHAGNPTTISLDIDGDMNFVQLGAPEKADITIGGNMNNSRFTGMNLNGTDTTSIHVTGDIINRSTYTTIDNVDAPPNLAYLAQSYPPNTLAANLASQLFYDPVNKTLTIQGAVTDGVLAVLQSLQVQVYVNGVPQVNPDGTPKVQTVSVIDANTAAQLQQQYALEGPVPTSFDSGYVIGGGGTFDISAHNIDLATTLGIQSQGVGYDVVTSVANDGSTSVSYPLAKQGTTGAKIVVHASGDLNMFSSDISSLNGGDIYVNAVGDIAVGSSVISIQTTSPRGIFSTGQGNVGVYAGGDINIDGSRVAVYDTRKLKPGIPTPGGSLTVVSRNGNIDVGSGGSGSALVNSYYVDPISGEVTLNNDSIPGSGILQTSYNLTGNVLVEALNGDVNIGAGGVKQVLFKGTQTTVNTDELATLFRLALEGNQAAALAYEKQINGVIPGAAIAFADVYAGYALEQLDNSQNPVLDADGNPMITAANQGQGTLTQISDNRSINAAGAGIVGAGTSNLKATGGIVGNIVSFGDVNLDANKNINVNVFGLGVVSVASAGGSVSGTIVAVGGINASGGSIDANLESNGSISGGTSGSAGFAASATAGNVAAGVANQNNAVVAKNTGDTSDDELNKKKKSIALAQKVSRVTVLLPKKN